jgi:lipopolysaccharide/colanic/teichoic acid biosynthesis glycosyltransferase
VGPVTDGDSACLALPIRIDAKIRRTAWPWAIVQRLFGVAACIVLLPVAIVVFVAVKSTSRGPFLFAQLRPGLGGKPFVVYKVRTMLVGAERETALGTSQGNPAITAVGRWLRALKLDELPQLWNIARGEMELVGPRPIPVALDAELRKHIASFALRYAVKPGLTSVSQVAVLDNKLEGRLVEDWGLRYEGELHYIKNKSFAYDVVALAMTALYVLRKLRKLRKLAPAVLTKSEERQSEGFEPPAAADCRR